MNLSFISHPIVWVAAIVVSEIKDKLSPNIAPQSKAAPTIFTSIPKELANPKAIGESETIVPTDVPEEVDKNDAIKNTPTKIYSAERYFIPKLTIASTLPIDLDTVAKAPANK